MIGLPSRDLRRLESSSSSAPISGGVVHDLPDDLGTALRAYPGALKTWEDITPLARNEWICWTISVKRDETRAKHVTRALEDLAAGKRRPCCWPGCPHREHRGARRLPEGS